MTQQLLTPKVTEQFTFCMRSPYGQDIWCKGIYREIVPPERIVRTDYFSDEEGGRHRAGGSSAETAERGFGRWTGPCISTTGTMDALAWPLRLEKSR